MKRIAYLKKDEVPDNGSFDRARLFNFINQTLPEYISNSRFGIKTNANDEFDTELPSSSINATKSLFAVLTIHGRNILYNICNVHKLLDNNAYAVDLIERYRVCQIKLGYIVNDLTDKKEPYKPKLVTDVTDNPNNIKTYKLTIDNEGFVHGYTDNNSDEKEFLEIESLQKFYYYKHKTEKQYKDKTGINLNLIQYIKSGKPVVVAQEDYGSGARCTAYNPKTTPSYDFYNARITKIYYEADMIIIKEFYRSCVNVSIFYKENLDGTSKSTGKFNDCIMFDFITGKFSHILDEKSLFLFHYNEQFLKDKIDPIKGIKNKLDKENIEKFINAYKNNNSDESNLIDYLFLVKNEIYKLRKTYHVEMNSTKAIDIDKDEGEVFKTNILVHRGGAEYTFSKGCLTVLGNEVEGIDENNKKLTWKTSGWGDYSKFKETFSDNKFGMLFLFREDLFAIGVL